MAKLIVTRPRLGSLWDIEQRFDVLIDGNPNAPIGLGETIGHPDTHRPGLSWLFWIRGDFVGVWIPRIQKNPDTHRLPGRRNLPGNPRSRT